MSQFAFLTCLLGMLIFGPAARLSADGGPPIAAQPAAPAPAGIRVNGPDQVLEGLVGTWDAQVSGGSAEVSGKPTSIGRVTREWVVDHKFVYEKGRAHFALITFDLRQGMYQAWYFHANGHVWHLTGRWFGNTGSLSLSAELDQNQSLSRTFQVLDDKRHECTVTWTDENGRTGVYGTLNFVRSDPAAKEISGKKPAPAVQTPPSPSPEMQIFANEVGKWNLEGNVTSDEKTTKFTGSTVVQWNLNGQFLEATTTLPEQKADTIYIAGFDAAAKTYRCWYFKADTTLREPAIGTWDEKERTMTWKYQLTSEFAMVSRKQWLNRDTAKLHGVCSRKDGTVYYTQEGTITRQKDK